MKTVPVELAELLNYASFRDYHKRCGAEFNNDVRRFLTSTMDEVRTSTSNRIARSILHIIDIRDFGLFRKVAEAEVLGEQRRQEIEQAAKRMAELERQVSTLQEGIAKAEALGDRQHQKAQTSAKRADQFLAEIIEMTGEFTEMSKQIREQAAEMNRLRAELENYRPGQ
jgi:chromosome segregation ATPase